LRRHPRMLPSAPRKQGAWSLGQEGPFLIYAVTKMPHHSSRQM